MQEIRKRKTSVKVTEINTDSENVFVGWKENIVGFIMLFLESIRILIHTFLVDKRACKIYRGPHFRNSLLVIGDDVAFGKGDSKNIFSIPGITSKLGAIFEKTKNIKQTWELYNCGVLNSTSTDWNQSLLEKLLTVKKYQNCKVVVIMLGYQDGLKRISPSLSKQNVQAIIETLKAHGIEKIIVVPGPTYHNHLMDGLYGDNLERNDELKRLATEQTVLWGPMISTLNYEYKGDFLYYGMLFSSRGYTKIAKDLSEDLVHQMVQVEFKQFKQKLGF